MILDIKAALRCDRCQVEFSVELDPADEAPVMGALFDAAFRGSCLSDQRGELCEACYEGALLAMGDDDDEIVWPGPLPGLDAFDPVHEDEDGAQQ